VNNLALFDFDGTITRKDTFLEIIKFAKGSTRFYVGFVLLTPVLICYKLKLLPNWRAKEIVFAYFFKNVSTETFQKICIEFVERKLPELIRPSAWLKLKQHLVALDRVVIVTASSADWILPWSEKHGIELIATKWEYQNGKITGKIKGRNCYGPVKKEMVLNLLNPSDYKSVSAYGDTTGDKEMLSLGTYVYYKYFND
jgi:phosphatidylglycerophosphatase C